MNIVLGIGNPGNDYRGTRHNIGFVVVDALAKGHRAAFRQWTPLIDRAVVDTPSVALCLVKPQTYVNQSGKTIPALLSEYGDLKENFMVVCDDINLPLGTLRIRAKGSSGGHNGLKSLIAALGTDEFPRLRLGIGAPEGVDAADYVLDRFQRSEAALVEDAVDRAVRAIELWNRRGITAAMNEFNPRSDKKGLDSEGASR